MRRNWWVVLVVLVAVALGSCRDCGVVGKDRHPSKELLAKKRIGPCKYEYMDPVQWWRAGFIAVEANDLALTSYELDEKNHTVSFPCERYYRMDAGEPTDVRILYIHF